MKDRRTNLKVTESRIISLHHRPLQSLRTGLGIFLFLSQDLWTNSPQCDDPALPFISLSVKSVDGETDKQMDDGEFKVPHTFIHNFHGTEDTKRMSLHNTSSICQPVLRGADRVHVSSLHCLHAPAGDSFSE